MLLRIVVLTSIFFIFLNVKAEDLKNCKWDNRNGIPCIAISKTPNTSYLSEGSVNKIVINRQEIEKSGAVDVVDVLNYIDGIDLKQNGQRGQLTSLFMRGTNSNHTLVLLNGIAINDQSTTQGLHNFGQNFISNMFQDWKRKLRLVKQSLKPMKIKKNLYIQQPDKLIKKHNKNIWLKQFFNLKVLNAEMHGGE